MEIQLDYPLITCMIFTVSAPIIFHLFGTIGLSSKWLHKKCRDEDEALQARYAQSIKMYRQTIEELYTKNKKIDTMICNLIQKYEQEQPTNDGLHMFIRNLKNDLTNIEQRTKRQKFEEYLYHKYGKFKIKIPKRDDATN
jgi:hypothetical protein